RDTSPSRPVWRSLSLGARERAQGPSFLPLLASLIRRGRLRPSFLLLFPTCLPHRGAGGLGGDHRPLGRPGAAWCSSEEGSAEGSARPSAERSLSPILLPHRPKAERPESDEHRAPRGTRP